MAAKVVENHHAFWRELGKRFDSARERYGNAISAHWCGPHSAADELRDSTWEVLKSSSPPFASDARGASWYFSWSDRLQGLDDAYRARILKRFEILAEEATLQLGNQCGPESVFFWLDRLRTESSGFQETGSVTGYHEGPKLVTCPCGRIDDLFGASAEYCGLLAARARADRLGGSGVQRALRRQSPKYGPEVATARAQERQKVIGPILKQKRWNLSRLVTDSGVGKASVYGYWNGTRQLKSENRKAIADALGLGFDKLPA